MKTRKFDKIPLEIASRQPIVFFDGKCTLCNSSVRFLIRYNTSGDLNFASLQSETGNRMLALAGMPAGEHNTILLLQNNELSGYSTAVLNLAAHLSIPWRIFGIFKIIPLSLRDSLYRFIAANRYKWFGQKEYCIKEDKDTIQRFLH